MSVASASLVGLLQKRRLRFFTTGDLALLAGLGSMAASQALGRLARQGLVQRFRRGLWANLSAPNLSLEEAVPQLSAPWPAYVSLHSALAQAGVLAEIPAVLSAVGCGPPRRFRTPMGEVRLRHIPERFLWGWRPPSAERPSLLMAEPEKALLDLAYLALLPSSPLRFPSLRPHHRRLDRQKLRAYAARMSYPRLDNFLKKKFL